MGHDSAEVRTSVVGELDGVDRVYLNPVRLESKGGAFVAHIAVNDVGLDRKNANTFRTGRHRTAEWHMGEAKSKVKKKVHFFFAWGLAEGRVLQLKPCLERTSTNFESRR